MHTIWSGPTGGMKIYEYSLEQLRDLSEMSRSRYIYLQYLWSSHSSSTLERLALSPVPSRPTQPGASVILCTRHTPPDLYSSTDKLALTYGTCMATRTESMHRNSNAQAPTSRATISLLPHTTTTTHPYTLTQWAYHTTTKSKSKTCHGTPKNPSFTIRAHAAIDSRFRARNWRITKMWRRVRVVVL
ncbi:hypothetical protein RSAG8_04573, partial [Rhizoctonia solani AG-8 WAC10335]